MQAASSQVSGVPPPEGHPEARRPPTARRAMKSAARGPARFSARPASVASLGRQLARRNSLWGHQKRAGRPRTRENAPRPEGLHLSPGPHATRPPVAVLAPSAEALGATGLFPQASRGFAAAFGPWSGATRLRATAAPSVNEHGANVGHLPGTLGGGCSLVLNDMPGRGWPTYSGSKVADRSANLPAEALAFPHEVVPGRDLAPTAARAARQLGISAHRIPEIGEDRPRDDRDHVIAPILAPEESAESLIDPGLPLRALRPADGRVMP
eukprot:6374412-Alexandrium_andersonii.AAC.2